jgi:hypothetical protein
VYNPEYNSCQEIEVQMGEKSLGHRMV